MEGVSSLVREDEAVSTGTTETRLGTCSRPGPGKRGAAPGGGSFGSEGTWNQAPSAASMFLVTTSIVWLSRSVGLNSTSEVPAKMLGVWPGPTE